MREPEAEANDNSWKSPDEDILKIVHAPQLPRRSISPTNTHMILSDRIIYPTLSELGAPMLKLAGTRVNPKNNYYHTRAYKGEEGRQQLTIKKLSGHFTVSTKL